MVGLALVAATAVFFAPLLSNGFVSLDDPAYLVENPFVNRGLSLDGVRWAFTTTRGGSWHPLTWLSHMLDVELFGLRPAGHHLAALGLHAANVLLLLAALHLLTGALWPSAAVAALFALHPLHVESVAWASERKDLLCAFFTLLALLCWARGARGARGARPASWLLFALALAAKQMPVTLPFVLLLLDWWPLGRWSPLAAGPPGAARPRLGVLPPAPLWAEKLPFFLLSAAFSAGAFLAQAGSGAVASTVRIDLPARLANAALASLQYLKMTLVPAGHSFYYPLASRVPAGVAVLALAALAALSGLALVQARRRPQLAVGWLWYLGMLVPVAGLVQIGGQARADRYTYLPLVGVFLALVWSARALLGRLPALRAPAAVVSLGGLLVLGALARGQAAVWRDDATLTAQALALDPKNWMAHTVRAISLLKAGDAPAARGHLEEALRVNPSAEVHFNLGVALGMLGDDRGAAGHYRQAVSLDPGKAEAHYNLGLIVARQGGAREALGHFEEAIRSDPGSAGAHFNAALALAALGRIAEGREHVRAGLSLAEPGRRRELETYFQGLAPGLADP